MAQVSCWIDLCTYVFLDAERTGTVNLHR